MLNCNRYVSLLGDRFKWGISIGLGAFNRVKFANGARRFEVYGPCVLSPATGHWPFHTFKFMTIDGDLAAWQCTILGITFGSQLLPNVNEDGTIAGPDYRKHYVFFSCLNHQDQLLEEIITNADNR